MSYKIKLKLSDGTGQNPTDIDCSKYDSTNVFDPHQASFTS